MIATRPLTRWLPARPVLAFLAAMLVLAAGLAIAISPLLAVAVFAAAIGLAATFLLPGVVFCIYLLIPYYKGELQQYSPIDLTVALAALTSLQAITLLIDRKSIRMPTLALALWLALAALILIGVLYARDVDLALARAINWLALVAVPIAIGAIRVSSRPAYVRQLLWTWFAVGAVVVIIGLLRLSSAERLEVLGANTIATATAALLVPVLGAAFVVPQGHPIRSILAVVLMPAAFIVALGTGSRGPLLVVVILAILGFVMLLPRMGSGHRRLLIVVAPILIVASIGVGAVAASSLPGESLERFSSFAAFVESLSSGRIDAAAGDNSSEIRVALFTLAITLFLQHPILGVGTAGFAILSVQRLSPVEADVYPHNSLLQFAAEYGLVGVALFAVIVAAALIRPAAGREAMVVKLLVVYYLLVGMTTGNVFDDRALWGVIMLALCLPGRDVPELDGSATTAQPDGPARSAASRAEAPSTG
jgi:O-antigen ligase